MNRSARASALVAAVLISGCGGGGGSDEPTYNAAAAWQALVAPPGVRDLIANGSSGAVNYRLQLTFTPLGTAVFPRGSVNSNRTDVRTQITANNVTDSSITEFYYTGAGQVIGARDPDTCSTVVTTLPPTAARLGDSGALETQTDFATCSTADTTVVSRNTSRWEIRSIESRPFFCYRVTYQNASGTSTGEAEETCVQVATDGALLQAVQITLQDSGLNLVARGGF